MARMKGGCPGQNTAYLKDFNSSIMACPHCGNEVEFFADEKKVRCSRCNNKIFKADPDIVEYREGKLVFNQKESSCLDWCGGCLESRDYQDIELNKKRIEQKKEDFKELVDSVDPKDTETIEFLVEAFKKSINHKKLLDPKVFDILKKKNPVLFLKVRDYYLDSFK
jgi:DNA-directed RNA polymerase subunit RPC12/RpoP